MTHLLMKKQDEKPPIPLKQKFKKSKNFRLFAVVVLKFTKNLSQLKL